MGPGFITNLGTSHFPEVDPFLTKILSDLAAHKHGHRRFSGFFEPRALFEGGTNIFKCHAQSRTPGLVKPGHIFPGPVELTTRFAHAFVLLLASTKSMVYTVMST